MGSDDIKREQLYGLENKLNLVVERINKAKITPKNKETLLKYAQLKKF